MKDQTSTCSGVTLTRVFLGAVLASLGLAAVWAAVVLAAPRKERSPLEATQGAAVTKPDGKELFAREWISRDPRSHGGDGLGPVFNDTSCVACHNQGGAGGGGPASKNVQILTTSSLARKSLALQSVGLQSFVLHLFSTDPEFANWRATTAQSTLPGGPMPAGDGPPGVGSGPGPGSG